MRSRRKRLYAIAKPDRSTASGYVISCSVVELGQRDRGNSHAAGQSRLHGLAHHLRSIRDRDPVEVFAEGADQYRFPEALNAGGLLTVAMKPILKRCSVIFFRYYGDERCQATAERDLVPRIKKLESKKRWHNVERSRQECRLQHRLPSTRLDEGHTIEPANFVFDSDCLIKLEQVGAETEEDVLTVVHYLASAGMFVRRGAAAEIRTAFEQGHAKSGLRERAT